MITRTLFALTAVLLLAACGGGGGGSAPPMMGDGDGSVPPMMDGVDRELVHAAAVRASRNLPRFGSVTQSSNGDPVSGVTTDIASITHGPAEYFELTIDRQDGTSLIFDSDTSYLDSMRRGFNSRFVFVELLDASDTHASYAFTHHSYFGNTDPTTLGYWLHVEGDLGGPIGSAEGVFSVTGIGKAEIGAFVVSGPQFADPVSLPNIGTARYQGWGRGIYILNEPTADLMGDRDTIETLVSEFTRLSLVGGIGVAEVRLEADFTNSTISGSISGSSPDFYRTVDRTVEESVSSAEIILHPAAFNPDGSFDGQQVSLSHWQGYHDPSTSEAIVTSSGTWGGRFSNATGASGIPQHVAGTFGVTGTRRDMIEATIVGYFGAVQR